MDEKLLEGDKKEERLNLLIEPPGVHLEFADLVHVNASAERVVITFVQKLPFMATVVPTEENQGFPARLIAQVAVSWQHFVRLVGLLNRVLADNKERLKGDWQSFLNSLDDD